MSLNPHPSPPTATRLRYGLGANLIGKISLVAIGVASVPLYIQFVGIAGYALVGLYAALQSMIVVLDLGLGSVVNREVAAARTGGTGAALRSFVRTVEIYYWGICIALVALAPLLARVLVGHWTSTSLTGPDVTRAAILLVAALALQFPFTVYSAVLLGAERHARYNSMLVGTSFARVAGGVAVLSALGGSLVAFFAWQAIVSTLQSVLAGHWAWSSLGGSRGARFLASGLLGAWRFAAGMAAVSLLGVATGSIDKIALSRVLAIEGYGAYALAAALASSLYLLATPVFLTMTPRMARANQESDGSFGLTYRLGIELTALAVVPAAVVVAFFSEDALYVWTGDPAAAHAAAPVAVFLAIGSAFVALGGMSSIAHICVRRTSPLVTVSLATFAAALAFVVLAAWARGGVGAAAAWALVNAASTLALVLAARRLVGAGAVRSWATSIARPLAASLAVAGIAFLTRPSDPDRLTLFAYVVLTSMASLAVAALSMSQARAFLRPYARSILGR